MLKEKYFMVFCSCPDEDTAAALARQLVTERLAACVNRIAGVHSTYFWEGAVQDEPEVLIVAKTTADRLATLSARMEALHPYEVPEVVAIGIAAGSERYLDWLGQTVAVGSNVGR